MATGAEPSAGARNWKADAGAWHWWKDGWQSGWSWRDDGGRGDSWGEDLTAARSNQRHRWKAEAEAETEAADEPWRFCASMVKPAPGDEALASDPVAHGKSLGDAWAGWAPKSRSAVEAGLAPRRCPAGAAAARASQRAEGPPEPPEPPTRAPLEALIAAEVAQFLKGVDLDTRSDEEAPIPDGETSNPQLPEHVRQVASDANRRGFVFICDLCAQSGASPAQALNSESQVQEHVAGKGRQKKLRQLTAGTLQLAE